MKIAVVHDWLTNNGGSENVVEEILRVFPQAILYTSVYDKKSVRGFYATDIRTTNLQKIPFIKYKHKLMSYLRAVYFEQLDLSEYDTVIVSSHAESKGIITRPNTNTICYCHTPIRYYWSDFQEYQEYMEFGFLNPIVKRLFPKFSSYMRLWDRSAADRIDRFVANSSEVSSRIRKYYNKPSTVIFPPADTDFFHYDDRVKREDYYFTISRLIPYKKVDVIAKAFANSGRKIYIAGEGPLRSQLMKEFKNNKNITFTGYISKEQVRDYYQKAKGFVYCAKEDFGIVLAEAQGCGCPVIAYKQGGAKDIVVNKVTGVLYDEQTSDSINKALDIFESLKIDSESCRDNSLRFSRQTFQKKLKEEVLKTK